MEVWDYLFAAGLGAYFIALLWNFRLSLAILPLFFPFYLWKFSVIGLPFNFIELMLGLAFIVWIWHLFKKKLDGYWNVDFWLEWGWWLLALILLSSTAVYTAAKTGIVVLPYEGKVFDSLKVALGIWKSWIVVPILFFVLWKNVLDNGWYKKVSWYAYLVSALILSLWALWQIWTGEFITIDGRASGPFVSANYLSLYIGPAVLGAVLWLWQYWSVLKKEEIAAQIFVFVICFAALIASRSYAAFLGIIAGLAFYFLFKFASWKKISTGLLIIFILGGIFIYFQKDTEKFRMLFQFEQRSSSSVRLQTWAVASNLAQGNWLTGIGLGQFEAQYQLTAKEILTVEPHEVTQLHPHNIFFSFWLNLGVLGLVWLLAFIYKVIKMRRADNLIYLSIFVLILVHGLFDQPFWKNDLSLLWWFLIALL